MAVDAAHSSPPRHDHYYFRTDGIKASKDKTYPDSIAELASPWGQAVNAGTLAGGKLAHFGSYREVFAGDQDETFTGPLTGVDHVRGPDPIKGAVALREVPIS